MEIIFDVILVKVYVRYVKILKDLGKMVVDLIFVVKGFFVCFFVNFGENFELENVNMIICGG